MKVTIEISLYPLQKKYKKIIKRFIKKLKGDKKIKTYTTAMSTYITGDYDQVMVAILVELKSVFQDIGNSAAVLKIVPCDLKIERGFIHI